MFTSCLQGDDPWKDDGSGKVNALSPLSGAMDAINQAYAQDSNMLLATWFDNLGYPEKDLDDKVCFFNSEKILGGESVIAHFNRDNYKSFSEKGVEFMCKKGRVGPVNQDNCFCIISGNNRIMGVFDGHGSNGNLASSFTMGAMVDYIQNAKVFKERPLHEMKKSEIEKALRKTFRYAQDKIKDQYRTYLMKKKQGRLQSLAKLVEEEGGEDEVVDDKRVPTISIPEQDAFAP